MSGRVIRLQRGGGVAKPLGWHNDSWRALGSKVRVQFYGTPDEGRQLGKWTREWLEHYEQTLSRFQSDSGISKLNQQAGKKVQADPLMIRLLEASAWAFDFSRGLIDPTILPGLQAGGYAERMPENKIDWDQVWNQPTHLAQSDPNSPWREVEWGADWARLPQGCGYDPGSVGKGLAADLLVEELISRTPAVLTNLGGDIRVHVQPGIPHFPLDLEDPRSDQVWKQLTMQSGACATSACCKRLWTQDNQPFHHLISPADRLPVWSRWAGASALAATALEAESRAKLTILSGKKEWLGEHGWAYPADPSKGPQ